LPYSPNTDLTITYQEPVIEKLIHEISNNSFPVAGQFRSWYMLPDDIDYEIIKTYGKVVSIESFVLTIEWYSDTDPESFTFVPLIRGEFIFDPIFRIVEYVTLDEVIAIAALSNDDLKKAN